MHDDYPSEPPASDLAAMDEQAESIELSYIRELNPSPPQTEAKKPLSTAEQTRLRRQFQKRKAEIYRIWKDWLEFEKPLIENEPDYHSFLFDTVRKISKELRLIRGSGTCGNPWTEARNRVFTEGFVDNASRKFNKSPTTIHHDVGKVSSHNRFMRGISDNQEVFILQEVQAEISGHVKTPEVVTSASPLPPAKDPAAPVGPVIMTAIEVKKFGMERTKAFRESEKAFLGDDVPPPKTELMEGLLSEVAEEVRAIRIMNPGMRLRRPRRNWRRL